MTPGQSVVYVSQVNSEQEFPATVLSVNSDGTVDLEVQSASTLHVKRKVQVFKGEKPFKLIRGQRVLLSFAKHEANG